MGSDIIDSDPEVMDSLKYLVITVEERARLQSLPFDGKKQCWIPDQKEGFIAAEIISTKGSDVTLKTTKGDNVTCKKDDVKEMNPPKFEKCEDMADLTYLNDASIFHNLRTRYLNWLIYTYSGLFCITINPFKRLPVYTHKIIALYRGKKKTEVPPHLYSIADGAYQNMLRDRENQSMLITGESGAGKTENTKKVIQYFASIAAADKKKSDEQSEKQASLEDQIVSANPVLEAYGNAKTTRNNNSSRFGKFIRIHFGPTGKIAGADIESYLLEKSRVIYQQSAERNYHIFYQLLAKNYPQYQADLLVQPDASLYHYINQGVLQIDKVDDGEEMRMTDEAFETLGFQHEEKLNLFKATAAIMHWGNAQWKQKVREDQAECDGTEDCEKVAHLLGLEGADLIKGLLKPRIKVGNEFVNKGQSKEQVQNAVGALSKSLFDRMFKWLVNRVNNTLDAKSKRQYFIGVLDIAGFEIFDFNTFEQLCINYTNERLQQFFNHHMFVLEQEEYKKEGIKWEMMNFGLDLQACIDLIEKPLGILSILEEECIVPKASDKTFIEKLYSTHLGKHPSFGKPKQQKGKTEAHFELHHYAGTVAYNITDWLNKNKDPINQTVATLIKNSKNNRLLNLVFGDVGEEEDQKGKSNSKKKSSGSSQTLSATHRDQLNKLMMTLKATSPHFVRCIIPNEIKTGGVLDAHLVMHQLTCNGVLEGIRICRKGFPNRMIYQEFKMRYSILASQALSNGFVDANKATSCILREISLNEDLFRLGNTKVFFKAGILGQLEELREAALSKVIRKLQAQIRSYFIRKEYKIMHEKREALDVLQRNAKKYLSLRNWGWWTLYSRVKPLLSNARQEEELKAKEVEMIKIKESLEKVAQAKRELEELVTKLQKENQDLNGKIEAEREILNDQSENKQALILQKAELESHVKDLESRIIELEGNITGIESKKIRIEEDLSTLKKEFDCLSTKCNKIEVDNKHKDAQIKELKENVQAQEISHGKILKEKKNVEECHQKVSDDLKKEHEKYLNLVKAKAKLEQTLNDLEDDFERERRVKNDIDKAKKRVEMDLKSTYEIVSTLEHVNTELEESVKRKDLEIFSLTSQLDESKIIINTVTSKLKESQQQTLNLQEKLESEKANKIKFDKQKTDWTIEIDELNIKVESLIKGSASCQEIIRKREAELTKMRKDYDSLRLQSETNMNQIKKKNQETINEHQDQVQSLERAKLKIEKEKQGLMIELEELGVKFDVILKGKTTADKCCKQLEQQVQDSLLKLEDYNQQINDLNHQKSNFQFEIKNLAKKLEEAESQIISYEKINTQLQTQMDEAKRKARDESNGRGSSLPYKHLNSEIESLKAQIEDERQAKAELQRTLSKTNQQSLQWKYKYETEALSKIKELEESRKKLALKLKEAEERADRSSSKGTNNEKSLTILQNELNDAMAEVERMNSNFLAADKKAKQFDKLANDLKINCDSMAIELENSQREAKQFSSELFKTKQHCIELVDQNEKIKKEARTLAEKVKELNKQLNEGVKQKPGSNNTHQRCEIEKYELRTALESAEKVQIAEKNKANRMQNEFNQYKINIDRILSQKDDEIQTLRRSNQRTLETMQNALECEVKAKNEVLKSKKKLETDSMELEKKLEILNRIATENQKIVKKLNVQISDLQNELQVEKELKDQANVSLVTTEKKLSCLNQEINSLKTTVEQLEKMKKEHQNEINGLNERIIELTSMNANIINKKRLIENERAVFCAEIEESESVAKIFDEKLKKVLNENNKLVDDLKKEQDKYIVVETQKKVLEQQLKDANDRLNQIDTYKEERRNRSYVEQQLKELQELIVEEQRQHQEALIQVKKHEKRIKELQIEIDDEKKSQFKFKELNESLEAKLKIYKKQAEDAEQIASLNLNKFRRLQSDLQDAEERASEANRLRNKSRSANSSVSPQRESSISRDQQQSRASSVSRSIRIGRL